MTTASDLAPGFADPVMQAQATFRRLMAAMAAPGSVHEAGDCTTAPAPLEPATAALLLTLLDFDTPLWLDSRAATEPVRDWLRFHTGAPIAAEPSVAAFAVVADAASMPPLAAFAAGDPSYPDRSTTVVIQVADLEQHGGWRISGPGIRGRARFGAHPLPDDFVAQWRANHALFPLGIDVVLTAGERLAALPRTTLIEEA